MTLTCTNTGFPIAQCGCGDNHYTQKRGFEPPTEMVSLREIKQRLAAIEADVNVLKGVGQELLTGQGVLCERLDALLKAQALFNDFLLGLLKPSEEPIKAAVDIMGGKVVFTPSHTLKLGKPKARRPRK